MRRIPVQARGEEFQGGRQEPAPQEDQDRPAGHRPSAGQDRHRHVKAPVYAFDARHDEERKVQAAIIDQLHGIERGDGQHAKEVGAGFAFILLAPHRDKPLEGVA
jgi:hypothetical protein